ncbi:MAG: hypothetical protein U9P49_13390 [Thermodesulfobacteriota bacterium]|nr:hypothetical protein [Thermodesulfobacteriota bacterium]
MAYKVLSNTEAGVIAAMGRGVIPRGGENFTLGAADLEDKWLPKTDYMLSRMPPLTRLGLRLGVRLLNCVWPLLYLRELTAMTSMDENELTEMFYMIENSEFPGPLSLLIVKILVFPAFYGLEEVKDAIGYKEKFPNHPDFEGLKD